MCIIQGNGLETRKLKVSGEVKANGLLLPFSNKSLLFSQQDRVPGQPLGVKLLFILDNLPVCWLL